MNLNVVAFATKDKKLGCSIPALQNATRNPALKTVNDNPPKIINTMKPVFHTYLGGITKDLITRLNALTNLLG